MNTIVVVMVLAVVGALIALAVSWRRGDAADLGAVSHQWIAEHRMGSGEDSRR
jgi:hypothetical protein